VRAVNLIPAEQREGAGGLAGRSGGAALIVLGLIAALALLAVLYGGAHRSQTKSRGELATVGAELSAARAQVGRMAPYTNFIAMANQRVQAVSQLVASRFDWSHAFNELGRVLPRDAVLTSLHGEVGGGPGAESSSSASASNATPTSSTPPGSTPVFTISGCATSQSEVAQTLQRLRLIDGVQGVTLQSSVKSSAKAGSANAAGPSGPCGPDAATFSAQIGFDELPGAPAAGAPATPGAPGAGAGAAGGGAPAGSQPVPVSNSPGGAR
jgi:Tfp pilus assembly protein PilN